MPFEVIMPQFGESVNEGTITRWMKAPGERVEEHEALLEINTDKVDAEVTCPGPGILLEIFVPAGQTVQAGTVLAVIGQPGEDLSALRAQQSNPIKDLPQEPAPVPPGPPLAGKPHAESHAQTAGKVTARQPVRMGRDEALGFISPLVAKMAAEHTVDLHQVRGSGLTGRITRDDLVAFIRDHPGLSASAQGTAPENAQPEDEILPLSLVRRRIAEHMVMSERTSPHVTTVMEADLKLVIEHRQAHKDDYAKQGVRLTLSSYFIAAAASALNAFPLVNASWSEAGIVLHRQINIGMAVARDEGLIVPVIRQAGKLSLLDLSRAVNDLADRARTQQLSPADVQGGTFTISNHGVTGSLVATPIIHQPQCAILGVGAVQKRPMVVQVDGEDAISIRSMVYLSLTFDHRILDGAAADHFLAKVVKSLQTWNEA
jgi:2-oxoglutarate dehydrogenase E2 component (dihydrolipoamide succinyltransferase)